MKPPSPAPAPAATPLRFPRGGIFVAMVLLTVVSQCPGEEALAARYAPLGSLLLTHFNAAPFPHPARAEGHRYKDKLYPADPHYRDNTAAIFVPKGFWATPRVDVVIHFHGWFNNVTNVLRQFQLPEQFAASKRNAILVVPQGPRDAPDSFGGKLEDAGGFGRFLEELQRAWKQLPGCGDAPLGRVILSGHSGGYRVIARCLVQPGATNLVREVWLFDALYAEADKYEAWWQGSHGRLLNIHTKDGGTRTETEKFMTRMTTLGAPVLSGTDESLTPAQLIGGLLVFLSTDLGHNEVVAKRKSFQRFLETSCLGPVPIESPTEPRK